MKFRNEYDRRLYEDAKKAYDAFIKFYPLTTADLDEESWKVIPDFPNYQASNFGRVKSFWFGKEKILKPTLSKVGYLKIEIIKDGKRKTLKIHRLVALLFIPNPEDKPQVNHKFGMKFDNFAENLEWATRSENIQHAYDFGLSKQGVDNSLSKIKSETDILYIRNNPDKLLQRELAEMFGVSKATIIGIQLGKKYKNIGGSIRASKPIKHSPKVPEEIKTQILARYKKGKHGCGYMALAKEFGYDAKTIYNIVKSAE